MNDHEAILGAIGAGLPTAIFSGTVLDSVTGEPVPGATVTLYAGSTPIKTLAASSAGKFNISGPGDSIGITSASYQSMIWPASTYQNVFELEPNAQTLTPIVASGKRADNSWMLLLLLPLFMQSQSSSRKRKVSGIGKIDTSTVVTIAVAGVALIGFSTVKKLFEGIALWDSAHTKALDATAQNPGSPWSTEMWKSAPGNYGIPLLSDQRMGDMLDTLINSFGIFSDDSNQAMAVFKSLQTQSQLSYFSDFFSKINLADGTGGDLLTWLRGSTWPNDRLSDAEVDQINSYILSLPRY